MTPVSDGTTVGTAREVRKLIVVSGTLLVALFGVIGTWAAVVDLHGAIVAPGILKVEANLKLVQPADGGVVRRIFVKEGQHVSQGDPIVELEDVEASASLGMVRDQLDAELARHARLTAEMRNAPGIEFPLELIGRKDAPNVRFLMRNEENLLQARNRQLREQSQKMGEQKKAILAEIASLALQIQAADKSLVYLKEQERMNESLHSQNFVANTRLLDAKRSTAEKEEKKFEFESLQAQARQRLADLELRLDALTSNRLTENSKELVDAQGKILNLRERLRPAKEIHARMIVKAPAAGTINVLRTHTEGGVVAPRETIAEIVPDQSHLIAEVRINPADIEEVKEGQEVEVELSGMNRRVTPLLMAKVSFVSPDLNTDQANPAIKYFIARVGLESAPPKTVSISAGMPVAAYIRTRSRSPLQLWLDPLIGAVRKSMRET